MNYLMRISGELKNLTKIFNFISKSFQKLFLNYFFLK